MKILIVEDHFLVAEALRLVLEEAGHEVVGIAANAPDAIRLAGEQSPDLALVDIQLAHQTCGIGAARAMRDHHRVPALLVTGNPDAAHAARDSALGYLEKPYRDQDILAALRVVELVLSGEKPSARPDRLKLFPPLPNGSE